MTSIPSIGHKRHETTECGLLVHRAKVVIAEQDSNLPRLQSARDSLQTVVRQLCRPVGQERLYRLDVLESKLLLIGQAFCSQFIFQLEFDELDVLSILKALRRSLERLISGGILLWDPTMDQGYAECRVQSHLFGLFKGAGFALCAYHRMCLVEIG